MNKEEDFVIDTKLAEEYAHKAADMCGMSYKEFMQLNNKSKRLIDLDKRHLIDIIVELLQFLDNEHIGCQNFYWDDICKNYQIDKDKCWDID